MPQINQFISDIVVSVNERVGDVTQQVLKVEESGAQALQGLASEIKRVGKNISEYQRKKDTLSRRITIDQAKNEAERARQTALDDALSDPDRAADGSDLSFTFDANFDEFKNQFLEGLDDKFKADAENIFEATRLQSNEKVLVQERQLHAEFVMQESDKIRQGYNSLTMNDPEGFSENKLSLEAHYDTLRANGLINDAQATSMKTEAVRENAMSAVNGMTMLDQDFDEAIERVTKGDLSSIFSVKEKANIINTIQNRKITHTNQLLQEESLERSELKRDKKEQSDLIFGNLMSQAISSSDETSRNKIRSFANQAQATGMLGNGQFAAIDRTLSGGSTQDDNNVKFDIIFRLTGGADPDVMNNLVHDMVASGSLTPKTGFSLLKSIKVVSSERKREGVNFYKAKLRNGRNKLDNVFGNKEFMDRLGGPNFRGKLLRRSEAEELFIKKLQENPGVDPQRAAEQVIIQLEGLSNIKSIQNVNAKLNLDTSQGIRTQMSIVKKALDNKQIDRARFNKTIIQLQERLKKIELTEQLKLSGSQVFRKIQSQDVRITAPGEEE